MTRKDYKILATALGVAGKGMGDWTWEATLDIVARSLRNNYPNFDQVRFEEAANTSRTTPCIVVYDATTPEGI